MELISQWPTNETTRTLSRVGAFLSLLLLCSCATTPEPSAIIPASKLPADVAIDRDAGRGNWLFVTLRLESGEELPFVLFCIYHPRGNSNGYAFVFRENGDSSVRHYRVARTSKDSPWKLQKAWRADQDDHTIEEYPVP